MFRYISNLNVFGVLVFLKMNRKSPTGYGNFHVKCTIKTNDKSLSRLHKFRNDLPLMEEMSCDKKRFLIQAVKRFLLSGNPSGDVSTNLPLKLMKTLYQRQFITT